MVNCLKKGDIIIICLVLILILVSCIFLFTGKTGNKVVISKDNNVLCELELKENKTIDLESNLIKIEDGKVFVESADCANQICVNHKPISKEKETIVCLPNKVLVEIK